MPSWPETIARKWALLLWLSRCPGSSSWMFYGFQVDESNLSDLLRIQDTALKSCCGISINCADCLCRQLNQVLIDVKIFVFVNERQRRREVCIIAWFIMKLVLIVMNWILSLVLPTEGVRGGRYVYCPLDVSSWGIDGINFQQRKIPVGVGQPAIPLAYFLLIVSDSVSTVSGNQRKC